MTALKIGIRVVVYGLCTLMIVLIVLHLVTTAVYFDFFNAAKGGFLIPGLDSAFVPQGFDYVEQEDVYLISGYMSDGTASRVYARSGDGTVVFSQLKNIDGSGYTGHSGGICHHGEFVFVAGHDGVEVFRLQDILKGADASNVGKIETGYEIAYCSFDNGYLLAGSFYHPGDYETPAQQRIMTPAGDANTALISVFRADDIYAFGIDPKPVAAVSTPGLVQGICFTAEDELVLSTSYSVASSHLSWYRIDAADAATIDLGYGEVPLLYLDSSKLTDRVAIPPMSEELVCRDGRVWILFESACEKYYYGRAIRGYQVFSYERKEVEGL